MLGALQRALDPKFWGIMANRGIAQRTMGDVSYSRSGGAGDVGDCTCIIRTPNGLRGNSGPRIDRIPPTRPPWRRRQFRELKKNNFCGPTKCPIDLFGPPANRTVLKRLRVVCLPPSVLHRYPRAAAASSLTAIAIKSCSPSSVGAMRAPLRTPC